MTRKRGKNPDKLRAIAYHEAGHAVITVVLGLTVHNVTIVPNGDDLGACWKPGMLGYRTANRRELRSLARDHIICLYAGMHAERLVDLNAPDFHGESDEMTAFDLSKRYEVFPRVLEFVGDENHLAYLSSLRAESRRLVRRHQKVIQKVAQALLVQRELNGAETKQIIEEILHL
jgi:ATP-dependent Zn protease